MCRKHSRWVRGLLPGLVLVLLCGLSARAQSISTRHHLTAHAQLILHMDALESSWEVMNARANEPNKGITAEAPALPGDEQLARELRATMGEVKLELSPKVRDFILFFSKQRRSSTEAVLGVASIYAPV